MRKVFKQAVSTMLVSMMLVSTMLGRASIMYADETTLTGEGNDTESETISVEDREYRRIFVAGDDTVCNWDTVGTDYREAGAYDPQSGWVEMLASHIKDSNTLKIQNAANTGFSIKTYYDGSTLRFSNTNQYTALLGTAGGGQPGDYVLIQFAQHDAKVPNDTMSEKDKGYAEEAYVDVATYKEYLKKYIADARALYVTPILLTPIADWNVDENGNFVSSYAEYAQAVREVAAEEGTLLIDMDQKSREFYKTLDEEELKKVFLFCEPEEYDTKHSAGAEDKENFQIYGSVHMARMLAEGLVETGEEYLVENIISTDLPTGAPKTPEVKVVTSKEKIFTMQWSTDKAAQVYFVYQMVDGEWKLVKQTESTVFNVNAPIDKDNCEYKVVAMNNIGTSDESNVVKRELVAKQETTPVQTTNEEKREQHIANSNHGNTSSGNYYSSRYNCNKEA